MNWLKSETSHASGYGSPVYTYIKDMSEAAIEDVKYEIRNGPDGDRDRFREPRWTLLDKLPPDVMARKLRSAESGVRSAQRWLEMMQEEAARA